MSEDWQQRARKVIQELSEMYAMNYVDYHYALSELEADRMAKAFAEAADLADELA